MNYDDLISDRAKSIDVSGIRRVFELGAKLENPINLSIGQPHFPVPDVMKRAAIEAVESDRNGYTLTQGDPTLRERIAGHLRDDVGWTIDGETLDVMVTSGTSGALLLSFLALLDAGDEAIIPDPYFVIYPALGPITGGTIRYCDTYPDFRMTAERVEPLITDRTRLVLVDSPANPTGVVLSDRELADLADLCRSRNIVLLSDEIYDEFIYDGHDGNGRCPSPARHWSGTLLIRGFGKSYGCTGWRMGYAAGPRPLIAQMAKLQQYTFVCAPSMAQHGCLAAFEADISGHVEDYRRKRDLVYEKLADVATVTRPSGAFYAFVEVPPKLGLTGMEFVERALERNVLIIPGSVFSQRDTHFRLSYAVDDARLVEGLEILRELLAGG